MWQTNSSFYAFIITWASVGNAVSVWVVADVARTVAVRIGYPLRWVQYAKLNLFGNIRLSFQMSLKSNVSTKDQRSKKKLCSQSNNVKKQVILTCRISQETSTFLCPQSNKVLTSYKRGY